MSPALLEGSSREDLPYPAFGWRWESCQRYKWKAHGHISVLTIVAVVNYIRKTVFITHDHVL